MSNVLKISITGLLVIITVITGIWIAETGEPYNTAVFTAHKLAALAALIFAAIIIIGFIRKTGASSVVYVFAIATGIFYLAAITSGGLLSIEKTLEDILEITHKISSIASITGLAVVFYLLLTGKFIRK